MEMAHKRGVGVRWVEGLATLQAYAIGTDGHRRRDIGKGNRGQTQGNTRYNAKKKEILFIERDQRKIRPPVIRLEENSEPDKHKGQY